MPPITKNFALHFLFTPTSMLNESVFSLSSFLSTFLFPKFLPHFLFFVLSSLVYSTWAQVSLGHCNLRNGAGTLLLLYISFTTTPVLRSRRHATLPSTFPHSPGLFSVASPLTHVLLPIASCLQHLPFPSCCLSVSNHVYSLFYLAL